MTRPPRILHIGQRKTGTTWLQAKAQNAARAGILDFRHWEMFPILKGLNWRSATEDKLDAALAVLPDEGARPCLASYELLIVIDPEVLARATARRWPDAQILITTRAPADYLLSSFNNDSFTRGGSAQDFAAGFVRNHMSRVFDLDARVAAFEAVFGPGCVHFLPYEMLRSDPGRYLGRLESLIGADLSGFEPRGRLNESPPPQFLLLQRRVNRLIEAEAPDVFKSADWIQFKLMANFSAGAAKQALQGHFADYFAAYPIEESSLPVLPEGALASLASRMTVLRDLPDYRDLLPLYGLSPAG